VDRIFWSRGQELANGRHVSQVERELGVLQLEPLVRVRLETAEQELREIPTKDAGALADLIHKEKDLSGPTNEVRMRGLLYEALGMIYARNDDDNDNLLTWHNKTLWLSGLGILLLISLEGVRRGGGGLFVVGATGGFMSRLMRTLKRDNVPTDYGAYWTTLFLSPLVGALAGWTGILLIELAAKLQVLGSVFDVVKLQMPDGYGNLTLGIAFLLGFSERLFDGILKPLEERIEKKAQAGSSSSSNGSSGVPAGSSSSARNNMPLAWSSSALSSRGGASLSAASSSSHARSSSSLRSSSSSSSSSSGSSGSSSGSGST
jgi:hypothetical protein